MALDLEAVVLHPHRMVQIPSAVGQPLPQLRNGFDAHLELVAQPVETVATRHCRGVQLQDRAHMQRLRRRLQIQQAGMQSLSRSIRDPLDSENSSIRS